MPNFVQLYKSTDLNAPVLTGSVNSLPRVLSAVLVNGYGSANFIISMSGNGVTTTATVASTSGLVTGQTVTVAGASIGAMNGTFTITVATGTTFTYLSAGNGTPTGTITYVPALPITSITRSGATATATLAQANTTLASIALTVYVTISGAVETDYNGTFQATFVDSTHFTYTVANSPASPATGTITYEKAGLGWAHPFAAGTNSQTYRSADTGSNRFYLQVIDNAATAGLGKEAQAYGAEVMSGDQAVTSGQFPTPGQAANGVCFSKSSTADNTTARAWTIFGDDRTFYLFVHASVGAGTRMYGFGHFISNKASDGYNTFISGETSFNLSTSSNGLGQVMAAGATTSNSSGSPYCARSYSQAGGSIQLNQLGNGNGATLAGGSSGVAILGYPNGPNHGTYIIPITLWEVSAGPHMRGKLPGVYSPLFGAPAANWNTYDPLTNVDGLSGVTFTGMRSDYSAANNTNTQGYVFIDTYGPWT